MIRPQQTMTQKLYRFIVNAGRPVSIRDLVKLCNSPHQYKRSLLAMGIVSYYRTIKGKSLIFFERVER